MEQQLLSLFLILSFLLITTLLVIKLVVKLWWRPKKIEKHFSNQGIRGPSYRFFFGNVKEIVGMALKASSQPMSSFSHNVLPTVLPFCHHWKKIYGTTFLVWFGPTVRVTISDPNLIREIFTSKAEFYDKIEAPTLVRQLEGDGLLSLTGQKWAHHRRIISPTFHMENLKLMIPVMATSMIEMMDKWLSMVEKGDIEIEISKWFQALTEDVITRTVFGKSYEDGKAIFQLQAQQMALASDAYHKVLIPGYRFFPTRRNIRSWKLDKEMKKSLVKLIEKRKEKLCEEDIDDEDVMKHKDLLGIMINASKINNNALLTVDDIVEECKTFFFAGKHTTSNLLTWTTILLAMYPQWQVRAREELLSVCGARDVPIKEELANLKTLTMIMNESLLRLYPPTVATIRKTKADVELGGTYKIPSGTELLIPIVAVHHDHATWGSDANEFNPDRFSNGVSRAARQPFAFIPFGLGARTCIGQNLAILQTKLALTIMLHRFSFRLAPSYQHEPTVQILLYPRYGAPVIFKPLYARQEMIG